MTSLINQQASSPEAQELKIIQDGSRPSEEIVLSSEYFAQNSDPNTVLTNPEIQKHLRLLHERAKQKGDSVIVDDVTERRRLLVTKLHAYNRRSEVGAFKVTISESPDDLSYTGPIKFYHQATETSREICRVVSLSNGDCVRILIPKLREKFNIENDVKCTLREMINGDEILLDPDDRPLDIAVNSKSPVTFHLVAGSNRSAELLRSLKSERFSAEQRKQLIEKYNLRTEEDISPVTSSVSTPRHKASLSGSSPSWSLHQSTPGSNHRHTSLETEQHEMAKANGRSDLHRKASLKETSMFSASPKSRHIRCNSVPKNSNNIVSEFSTPLNSKVKHPLPPPTKPHNSASRTGRVRQVKQKSKDGGLGNRRPSRSASARKLFLSLRKYRRRSSSRDRGGTKPPSDSEEDPTASAKSSELSSDASLPGILKIFGDHVSPGANYKSVMATTNSTAKELVKIALERYGLSRKEEPRHVLCEVVGKFKDERNSKGVPRGLKIKAQKHKKKDPARNSCSPAGIGAPERGPAGIGAPEREFQEDYVRPLSDQEKPLVLQSYWKPQDGLCRRFEIRRKSKVFTSTDEDHSTRDINSQAKRLVLQKSKTAPNLQTVQNLQAGRRESDAEKITSFEESISREVESNDPGSDQRESIDTHSHRESIDTHSQRESIATHSSQQSNNNESNQNKSDGESGGSPSALKKTSDRLTPDGVSSHSTPKVDPEAKLYNPPAPYLITLQGNEDNLIHSLDKPEVLIGSDVTDFKLDAPDVLRHHCVIKKRLEFVFSEKANFEAAKRWSVTIHPLIPAAEVRINGGRITAKHSLQHGDMVSVGKHHLFMYKDPTCHINLSSLVNLSYLQSSRDSDNCSTEAHGSNTSLNTATGPNKQPTPRLMGRIETLFNYRSENEDEVLKDIFNFIHDFDNPPHQQVVLFPATLLCHCITHSCLNFELQAKNDSLLKTASTMQTLVLNATRQVSVNELQTSHESLNSGSNLIQSLHPVAFWMSNSLEVFGFLQKDLESLMKEIVQEERQKGSVDPHLLECAEQFTVNEEFLALLEEVVMYAFQQLVYYLTKTLYSCLPAVLESNPFADEPTHSMDVAQITHVFAQARQMMSTYDVNKQIREQLFAYLFFFTNVSLFNTLMEEGSSRYYKWEMGVRIRGNLELLEAWAEENECMEQCVKHLEKISALANLLATPRGQFIKGSWFTFRKSFPALNPAQLRKLLTGYQMPGGNQSKPSTWNPPVDELSQPLDADSVLESYDNHPPLMLPMSGSRVNLRKLPDHPSLSGFYERVQGRGAWLSDDHVMAGQLDTSRRERPDGRELPGSEIVTMSLNHEIVTSKMNKLEVVEAAEELLPAPNVSTALVDSDKKNFENGGHMSSSSQCSTSSEPEAYVTHQQTTEKNDVTGKSNDLIKRSRDVMHHLMEEEAIDELVVLPVGETSSLMSHIAPNVGTPMTSPTNLLQEAGMPKEVFIVDIKRGRTGLGVGLIDGLATSFAATGVYVRSLIPDNPTSKHSPTKHHDVIRCWLQEGRLQLGDRILAANGVSIINMTYYEAIKTIKHAGDKVRLLVGRCGNDVASKIASSNSC